MQIIYIPDSEYAAYIKAQIKRELRGVEGKMRWFVTDQDGVEKIVRPESTKNI